MATQVAGELYQDLTGQLFEIGRQLRQKNGYPFNPETLKRHLQLAIEGGFVNGDQFSAVVDYGLSLAEMIAAGKYDMMNDEITAKRFPVKGKGHANNIDFKIVHFNRNISTGDALNELDLRGLRPATIEEILAFGAKYPNEQRKYPIVALGSVGVYSNGYRMVASLDEIDSKRLLFLYYVDGVWFVFFRFLAVGK